MPEALLLLAKEGIGLGGRREPLLAAGQHHPVNGQAASTRTLQESRDTQAAALENLQRILQFSQDRDQADQMLTLPLGSGTLCFRTCCGRGLLRSQDT